MNAIQARPLDAPVQSIPGAAHSAGRVLYHLARADLFERTRRYSFLMTLGFIIFTAYLYLPPRDAGYVTMGLANYRGVYNSAWIGGAMAMLCSALLSLPAFYLVKGAVGRDQRTRVGQILATTPLSKPLYTLGKAFSNFVFLALAVGVIGVAGLGMQLLRAEDWAVDLWALFSPFIFVVLPAMAVIGAVAVLFETISWLRGTFGNVVYFFLWLAQLLLMAAQNPRVAGRIPPPGNDLWGVSIITSSMMTDAVAAFPGYLGGFSIGMATLLAPLQTFAWLGVQWTAGIILGRLLWVGAAVGLALLASIFFRRFDPSPEQARTGNGQGRSRIGDTESEMHNGVSVPSATVQLSPLVARYAPRLGALLVAELRVLLKGMRWWWYLVALGLIAAGLLVPINIARFLLLAAWLWPLPLWSSLGTREVRYHSGALVFSTPRLLLRQLPLLWLSGCLVAVVTGSGVAVNFARAGEWMHLLAWGTAAGFIPALALTLGVWSSNRKLFEVLYMVWWYAGPANQVPALDFMGVGERVDPAFLLPYWVGTVVLLALAILGRQRQARTG